MRTFSVKSLIVLAAFVICLGGLWAILPATAADEQAAPPPLTNADCAKCHPEQVGIIAKDGAKHKTEVGCLDCHVEHPPMGAKAIPECSMCHSGKPHYEIGNCGACHTNTHSPLAITFPEKSTPACLSCHPAEGKQMKQFPSAHAKQDCTLCHPEKHRAILKCMECHSPHFEGQTYEECLNCHKPHMPTNIVFSKPPENTVCNACHAEIGKQLDMTQTKHHDLQCVFCHRDKHPMVPTCETCHGQPHPAAMHKKFPNCNQCHQGAHALVK